MTIDRIYLGTWIPRTHIHLVEIDEFLRSGGFAVRDLVFNNNVDMDSLRFSSGNAEVIITEDGVVQISSKRTENIRQGIGDIEDFYVKNLGPALAKLFSRGAPLPITLIELEEVYPKIILGRNIERSDAERIAKELDTEIISSTGGDGEYIYSGNDVLILSTNKGDTDELVTNMIFIDAVTDLLKRCLIAHRNVWDEIDKIRNSNSIKYSDFPVIRKKILESMKNISFIKTRLLQTSEILSGVESMISKEMKQRLLSIGLHDMKLLDAETRYFDKLWDMTSEYANSTLNLLESLVNENTQRELRVLQHVTIIGALAGFFGMNIAFPWDERWPHAFTSSVEVISLMVAITVIIYLCMKISISRRRFDIQSLDETKLDF